MNPLHEELQIPKRKLEDFASLTKRILSYLPETISGYSEAGRYKLFHSEIAGAIKYTRPVNQYLFVDKVYDFTDHFNKLNRILERINDNEEDFNEKENDIIDKTLYTIQQSIGVGFDLLLNPNSARKHAGNRFEELIKSVFTNAGIANRKIILSVPYQDEKKEKTYKCENDLVISPFENVKSTKKKFNEEEIIVSVKTTSKDRMGKIFMAKLLMERIVGHPQKVIGIFLNDVQRKDKHKTSYTLVSGLFMVYNKFLTPLEGVYYLDLPPVAERLPYSNYIKRLSVLLTNDIQTIFKT